MDICELNKYRKIIGWGAGYIFGNLYKTNFPVEYIVDSDEKKWGTECRGVRVFSPEKIINENMEDICIIIFAETYWRQIINQINGMGITADVFLMSMINPNPYSLKSSVRQSFALYAEDAIIQGISQRYDIKINNYVDIGCNHPIYGNATILFYLQGAAGCLIEPNINLIDELKQIRKKDTVFNVGIASAENNGKKQEFFEIEEINTRSTFSKEVAEQYRRKGFSIKSRMVKLMSLNAILEQYNKKVNYISIDVEGLEYEIVKSFDFNKFDVEFFNIEMGDERVREHMNNNNYEVVAETPSNWIFLRKGVVEKWD